MHPALCHRFLSPDRTVILCLSWPEPERSGWGRFKAALRDLLVEGISPDSPRAKVPSKGFRRTFEVLAAGDIDAAKAAFANLGYSVEVLSPGY